ncbi:MAG TPA: GIY-YIG nuclease family protein [Bacteroidetes bacterium]|nr:GIY-YIG nuclease family protein [Bacteroidota bacterium]
MKKAYSFYVYITTNPRKSTLYTGMTNNLMRRTIEHFLNRGDKESFAGRYYCYNVVWFEWHQYVFNAIAREKQIKKMPRPEKEALISKMNPKWGFYNCEICGMWPPNEELLAAIKKAKNDGAGNK